MTTPPRRPGPMPDPLPLPHPTGTRVRARPARRSAAARRPLVLALALALACAGAAAAPVAGTPAPPSTGPPRAAGGARPAPTGLPGVAAVVARLAHLTDAAPPSVAPGWTPPVAPAALRARFDPPAERWSAGHRGVDLDAPAGTAVLAPAAGTVVVAGVVVDRGVVTLQHDDGLRSSLEPVTGAPAVGTRVAPGDVVGRVQDGPARSHCTPRCLHWGVRDGEVYVDPLGLLPGGGPVVLLPGPVRGTA
ncbi:M23 family metallopeptidase [Actinotalea sp. JY-7876]|uniref:M23 family metallopeptidase n=2 Tax=unclassified Actinotalea TaxID=2638618 RepID=UPI00210725CA|nr:peptidoglycan DD-metalloendopeptidase family protein [Actinotalea sp. JY-7876]